MSVEAVLAVSVEVSYLLLAVATMLAVLRLVRGPGPADRVVALDLISMITVGFIAAHIVASGQAVFLDAAIVLALVAFLGTVAFARHVGRSSR